jgi:hypothetical protein
MELALPGIVGGWQQTGCGGGRWSLSGKIWEDNPLYIILCLQGKMRLDDEGGF